MEVVLNLEPRVPSRRLSWPSGLANYGGPRGIGVKGRFLGPDGVGMPPFKQKKREPVKTLFSKFTSEAQKILNDILYLFTRLFKLNFYVDSAGANACIRTFCCNRVNFSAQFLDSEINTIAFFNAS